jgi:hypothetical protein
MTVPQRGVLCLCTSADVLHNLYSSFLPSSFLLSSLPPSFPPFLLPSLLLSFFIVYSFIHMYIHCLGHLSLLLPFPSPFLSFMQ